MIETSVINLQLDELKEIVLDYYKAKLENEDLNIQTKIITECIQTSIQFTISTRKNVEPKMIINKDYRLNQDDVTEIINEYLAKENYEVCSWHYEFYETKDEIKNIQLYVKTKQENKFKKILKEKKKEWEEKHEISRIR